MVADRGNPDDAWAFSADRPIPGRRDDRFRRASFADALATQVLALPRNDSFVLGLVGPWGSGKTSILSMVEETLRPNEQVAVLNFNPWLFSGTEQLATHFFHEIAAQLRESTDRKLQEAGEKLMGYAEGLSPLGAIPFIGALAAQLAGGAKALAELMKQRGGALPASVMSQRRAITKLLREQDKRLLVIVDDLDRLPKEDIRELFKLVRLTADFPNTTYLLAFDRSRVEAALGETEGEGRAYLEKILQVMFDVPVLREPDLAKFLGTEIQKAVGERTHGPLDREQWENLFHLAVRPLFQTPRDVRRYTNSIPVALAVIGDEIAIADLLAIEAVRSLVPEVWSMIHGAMDLVTGRAHAHRVTHRADQDKAQFDKILGAAGEHREAIEQFLSRVFPPCRRFVDNTHYGAEWMKKWRKDRRLVHPDLLQFYFEKSLPPTILPGATVHEIFEKLGDETALREIIGGFDETTVEHVWARLEDYEADFPVAAIEPALVVFFEQYQRLREGRRGFEDFGAGIAIQRVGLRLLKRVDSEAERDGIVRRVYSRLRKLSERLELLDLVGWRANVGSKLVSRAASAELEQSLYESVSTASAEGLAEERDLMLLFHFADDGTDRIPTLCRTCAVHDLFMIRLLRSALRERDSLGVGDVAQRREQTLVWDYLVDLVGGGLLAQRIDQLVAGRDTIALTERERIALDTARRYREGWRPARFLGGARDASAPNAAEETPREERIYDPSILQHLLGSIVPARRALARERITHLVERAVAVPDAVVTLLISDACSEGGEIVERCALVDLVRHLGSGDRLLEPLTGQWFTSVAATPELARRIQAIYLDQPHRLPTLLDALERLPEASLDSPIVRDGVLTVGALLRQHGADLTHDIATRARSFISRFASTEALVAAVEHDFASRTNEGSHR